jgi:putative transposase
VFILKCRRKKLYQQLRQEPGDVIHQLAQRKQSQILEGHMVVDHVQMLISIPPKYAVSQVIGYIKGESVIHIARTAGGRQQKFTGEHFWARGYWVSTVGRDGKAIREYIQRQEEEDRRLDQMKTFE